MKESSSIDIGFLMAFGIPGFGALHALSYVSAPVRRAMGLLVDPHGTIGNAAALVVVAFAAGFVVSGIRQSGLDRLHHRTGVVSIAFKWKNLSTDNRLRAFKEAINNTWRFYQFYGNTLVALFLIVVLRYRPGGISVLEDAWVFFLSLAVMAALFDASRSSLIDTDKVLSSILD